MMDCIFLQHPAAIPPRAETVTAQQVCSHSDLSIASMYITLNDVRYARRTLRNGNHRTHGPRMLGMSILDLSIASMYITLGRRSV